MDEKKDKFMGEVKTAHEQGAFLKLTASRPIFVNNGPQKMTVRPVEIKKQKKFAFVLTYATKEITKNYSLEELLEQLELWVGKQFGNVLLFTSQKGVRLSFNRKRKSNVQYSRAPKAMKEITLKHDREKDRSIHTENNRYLEELGIVTPAGHLAPAMRSKYRQINRYVETLKGLIDASALRDKESLRVLDMGSGKGYLTFALYDFLTQTLQKKATVTGVELREELVSLCTAIAEKCAFESLTFSLGDIKGYPSEKMDILIALHACDTATDDALWQGIVSGAEIIVVAPCCHKQVRGEMNVTNDLKSIVAHGILKERQAELLTDTMRGLILEAHGYTTQIFEFITDEHTHKNVMITGVKNGRGKQEENLQHLQSLKNMFGVKKFYLEELFG